MKFYGQLDGVKWGLSDKIFSRGEQGGGQGQSVHRVFTLFYFVDTRCRVVLTFIKAFTATASIISARLIKGP